MECRELNLGLLHAGQMSYLYTIACCTNITRHCRYVLHLSLRLSSFWGGERLLCPVVLWIPALLSPGQLSPAPDLSFLKVGHTPFFLFVIMGVTFFVYFGATPSGAGGPCIVRNLTWGLCKACTPAPELTGPCYRAWEGREGLHAWWLGVPEAVHLVAVPIRKQIGEAAGCAWL